MANGEFVLKHQQKKYLGFSYLSLIFAIAIISISLSTFSELWSSVQKRQKEAELLIIGNQFRNAIAHYYEQTPGGGKQYPSSLDDLIKDNRNVVVQRHLRKLYIDPITGNNNWGLIKSPLGGIMGVHSLSENKPIKVMNFDVEYQEFKNKEKYSEWEFVYIPNSEIARPPIKPAEQSSSAVH